MAYVCLATAAHVTCNSALACDLRSSIVKIRATRCGPDSTDRRPRVQTGFFACGGPSRVQLITALHGIVDCKEVSAQPVLPAVTMQHLTLERVDLQRDVAFLLPPTEAQGRSCIPVRSAPLAAGAPAEVIGYPMDVSKSFRVDVRLGDDPLATWSEQDPQGAAEFKDRHSPDVDIPLLFMVQIGTLAPGHSGAPIVIGNEVVGVLLGGASQTGVAFGAPLAHVNSAPAGDRVREITKLGSIGLPHLFEHLVQSDRPNIELIESAEKDPSGTMNPKTELMQNNLKTGIRVIARGDRLHFVQRSGEETVVSFDGQPIKDLLCAFRRRLCFVSFERTIAAVEVDVPDAQPTKIPTGIERSGTPRLALSPHTERLVIAWPDSDEWLIEKGRPTSTAPRDSGFEGAKPPPGCRAESLRAGIALVTDVEAHVIAKSGTCEIVESLFDSEGNSPAVSIKATNRGFGRGPALPARDIVSLGGRELASFACEDDRLVAIVWEWGSAVPFGKRVAMSVLDVPCQSAFMEIARPVTVSGYGADVWIAVGEAVHHLRYLRSPTFHVLHVGTPVPVFGGEVVFKGADRLRQKGAGRFVVSSPNRSNEEVLVSEGEEKCTPTGSWCVAARSVTEETAEVVLKGWP